MIITKPKKIILTLCLILFSLVIEAKHVFITGGAGFIGSNFVNYMFKKYPNYHFTVLDKLTYAGNLNNLDSEVRESDRFTFVKGCITDVDLVDQLMSTADLVVHFAAESHVARSIVDDYVFFETDVLGTRALMAALVKYNKRIERFIHISTSEVFGTAEEFHMSEDHPINPRTPYAAAKAGADRLVYAYWCTYDIPAVIVRPFNNYGPNQHVEKLIPRLIAQAIEGVPLTIHGNGEQKRDWVHTFDIARALDQILHAENFSRIKNQAINLGSGRATSVNEIADTILAHFALPNDFKNYTKDRPGQVMLHISDTRKALELLGWEPKISIEDGLKSVIEWYKNNADHWTENLKTCRIPIVHEDNVVEHY